MSELARRLNRNRAWAALGLVSVGLASVGCSANTQHESASYPYVTSADVLGDQAAMFQLAQKVEQTSAPNIHHRAAQIADVTLHHGMMVEVSTTDNTSEKDVTTYVYNPTTTPGEPHGQLRAWLQTTYNRRNNTVFQMAITYDNTSSWELQGTSDRPITTQTPARRDPNGMTVRLDNAHNPAQVWTFPASDYGAFGLSAAELNLLHAANNDVGSLLPTVENPAPGLHMPTPNTPGAHLLQ